MNQFRMIGCDCFIKTMISYSVFNLLERIIYKQSKLSKIPSTAFYNKKEKKAKAKMEIEKRLKYYLGPLVFWLSEATFLKQP